MVYNTSTLVCNKRAVLCLFLAIMTPGLCESSLLVAVYGPNLFNMKLYSLHM